MEMKIAVRGRETLVEVDEDVLRVDPPNKTSVFVILSSQKVCGDLHF